VPVLAVSILVTFAAIRALPGDPVSVMLSDHSATRRWPQGWRPSTGSTARGAPVYLGHATRPVSGCRSGMYMRYDSPETAVRFSPAAGRSRGRSSPYSAASLAAISLSAEWSDSMTETGRGQSADGREGDQDGHRQHRHQAHQATQEETAHRSS